MKKYEIKFTRDYASEKLVKGLDYPYRLNYEQYVDFCKKWRGKKITILELEKLIKEFDVVVFDGETIEIYNDYRE